MTLGFSFLLSFSVAELENAQHQNLRFVLVFLEQRRKDKAGATLR